MGYVAEPIAGDEYMAGRIAFPYWNLRGVTAIRFRATPGMEGPKFMSRAGAVDTLYNITVIDNGGDTIYMTEGEPDCIIANQLGLPAVALSGVQKWKPHFEHLLSGYSTIKVICDNDDSGQGAELGEKIKHEMADAYVQILKAPPGHDLNSAYLEMGKDALFEYWEL